MVELTRKKHRLVQLIRGGASLNDLYWMLPWSRNAVRHARRQDPAFDARVRAAMNDEEEPTDEWD